MDWFRWYHGTVNDPKFRVVAAASKQPLTVVLAVFAAFAERASSATERGDISGWDAEAIGAGLEITPEAVQAVYAAMQRRMLDADSFSAWKARQPKREREDPTALDRKQAQRLRDKAANSNTCEGVTPGHATSHPVTPRGEEKRVEERDSSPPIVPPSPISARSSKTPSRGTRWPNGEPVPGSWIEGMRGALAAKGLPQIDLDLEALRFVNHWTAKAGQQATKLDWKRTWMNWAIEASSRAASRGRK